LKIQADTADASIKPNKLPEILCLASVLFQKQIQTSYVFSNKSLLGSLGMKDTTQQDTLFKSYSDPVRTGQ
jgi:hypothetical protein